MRCQHTFQTLPGTVRGELMFHVVYGRQQGKVWIDDLSIRELPQPEQVPIQGRVFSNRDGEEIRAEWNGIQLDATIRGLSDRIAIEGVLRDTTGRDRCVQLTWRLPLSAKGWRWYTGLDSFQVIEAGRTYANGAVGVPWFVHLLDGISREGWSPEMKGYQRIRMLMYQKTCGDWGGIRWRLSDAEIERRLNTCLTYAWWPGIDGAPQETFDRKRPIFKRYIPLLRNLAQAGWEPVTHAVAKPERAVIERFGGEGGRRLFFTVPNPEQGPQDISVTVDARALGLPADRLRVFDALAGEEIGPVIRDVAGALSFSLKVPAQTTAVLRIE